MATEKEIAALLNGLIELDGSVVAGYQVAIDRLDDEDDRAQLTEFKADHERHGRELEQLVTKLGDVPVAKPDLKTIVTRLKVMLAGLIGDRAILLALKTHGKGTQLAYERALLRDDLPADVREVLIRGRDDERRHHAYVDKRVADLASGEEVQEGARTGRPVARGERTPGLR
jgi:rubrerythrin